jgi:hypothetical protein
MTQKESSGWAVGFTVFASFLMMMMGVWWIISGLVALFNSEFYVVTLRWIFQFDVSVWGWIHLLLGILILVAGIFLFRGAVWARTVGVIIAVVPGCWLLPGCPTTRSGRSSSSPCRWP